MQMHAHRCEVCKQNGSLVYWIHGDDQQGIAESHTCPKCGNKEWKKWLIEVPKIPQVPPRAQQPQISFSIDWYQIYLILLCVAMTIIIVRYGFEILGWWKEHGKETLSKTVKK